MLKILVLILALAPVSALAQESQSGLTITGNARVVVEPDIVRASGGIYVQDDSATDAVEKATQRLSRLRTAMEPLGKVSASRITVGQGRSAGKRLIGSDDPGFVARGNLTVTLTDLDKAGMVLDAFAKAGIDGVARLDYDIQDRAPTVIDVREKAVADAIERAEAYARAAKLTLGPIVELTEIRSDSSTPQNGGVSYGASSYGAKGAPGPGVIGFGATVTIRWAVE